MTGDHVCPWWLISTFDNPLRRLVHKPEQILAGLVGEGETVLDIGCGMGYFSVPLARLVGPAGQVYAVDLQEKMLAGVARRAERAGMLDRIHLHQARPEGLGLLLRADLALAFWMLHEVPDQERFLSAVHNLLRQGGRFLLVEPVVHVSARAFQASVEQARSVGFVPVREVAIKWSRAVLFTIGGMS
jgi:ubiquinone/menaquinone biosynthesis C-methylase UbiE